MANYIDVKCPGCNKKFTSADDIVVCPVCGAPHHRGCYNEHGQCVFEQDHMSGKTWQPPAPDPASEQSRREELRSCSRCGTPNPQENVFCQVCGNRMSVQRQEQQNAWGQGVFRMEFDPILLRYGGLSPDETIDGEPIEEIASYVGPNSAYYLPLFKEMMQTGRRVTFNLSALIFNFLYFFYRKMYLAGSILLVFFLASRVPALLWSIEVLPDTLMRAGMLDLLQAQGIQISTEIDWALAARLETVKDWAFIIHLAVSMVVSLYANRLYCERAIRLVREIRGKTGEGMQRLQYLHALGDAGGCSRGLVAAIVITLSVLFLIGSYLLSYYYLYSGLF